MSVEMRVQISTFNTVSVHIKYASNVATYYFSDVMHFVSCIARNELPVCRHVSIVLPSCDITARLGVGYRTQVLLIVLAYCTEVSL